jgi:hypothetical protein
VAALWVVDGREEEWRRVGRGNNDGEYWIGRQALKRKKRKKKKGLSSRQAPPYVVNESGQAVFAGQGRAKGRKINRHINMPAMQRGKSPQVAATPPHLPILWARTKTTHESRPRR